MATALLIFLAAATLSAAWLTLGLVLDWVDRRRERRWKEISSRMRKA